MITINKELIPVFENALIDSLNYFESNNKESSLSDLYLNLDKENATLSIYDDMESKLLEVNFENYHVDDTEDFDMQLIATLKYALQQFEQKQSFNRDFIVKPFAVSLVDDDFVISEELIFIDDDTLKVDENLLTDLDKQLDDFFKDLMK
ncbi:MAG: hypothetical protein LBR67_10420 [Dysgonamonadaceae bacterium]|jgi:hypothetical protein|nr:hypothetical protein [Dysgonamonadaceae bacterium]